jgi:hypothetical protein
MFERFWCWLAGLTWESRRWVERLPERFWCWLAWYTPRRLVYWCAIRLMAHATMGPWSAQVVPELVAMDALKRWEP